MKPTLQLRIGQHLTMTPQLQQAIKLLQLSTIELQQEIQTAIETNPLLEIAQDEGDENDSLDGRANDLATLESRLYPDEQSSDPFDFQTAETSLTHQDRIPDELPVDSAWEDIYPSATGTSHSQQGDGDDEFNFDDRNGAQETLQDSLLWQLNLTPMSALDRNIGAAIIESLDYKGYLTAPLNDILETVRTDPEFRDQADDIDLDEVVAVLHRIQHFDPPGVAARDLQECLLIQLQQLPESTNRRSEALTLIQHHLELLSQRDFPQLMKRCKLSETALKETLHLIQSLNPFPGEKIQPDNTQYITPDVIVRREQDRWTVELNTDALPKLKINPLYAGLAQKKSHSAEDSSYLRNHLQEARWLIKSLQSRNETLLKVATKIVEHQLDFLERGAEFMKPLVLHHIAEAIEMHESTISRVTTHKYMLTPQGIFELKYFFSSHVATSTGGECSSTAIRAIIKKLIAAEDSRKPLSDSKIADVLAEQQIEVARRTIAKYRESLNIPASSERKRFI